MADVDVTGVRETLAMLRTVDRALWRQAVADLKAPANAMAAGIRSELPKGPPLSGFDHKGRTGWGGSRPGVRAKMSGSLSARKSRTPLLSVSVTGAAVQIADMAGRGGGGGRLAGALGRYGRASRWVWPAAVRRQRDVLDGVEKAAAAVQRDYTRSMAYRGR